MLDSAIRICADCNLDALPMKELQVGLWICDPLVPAEGPPHSKCWHIECPSRLHEVTDIIADDRAQNHTVFKSIRTRVDRIDGVLLCPRMNGYPKPVTVTFVDDGFHHV